MSQHIFQHICRIEITKENMQLARRALSEPDAVSAEADTVLGKTSTWDGRAVEARLCGRPGQTALLAVAVFAPDGELETYRNSTGYQSGFTFTHRGVEFVVCLVPENRPAKDIGGAT